jgi:hydrogenase expression/formation protein HypE
MLTLPAGKIHPATLERILASSRPRDPRVVVGPRVGEDAAIIDMGARYLVATTDPITFATDELAWYAVHVNANDVAVRGAEPRWFLVTLLLPVRGATEASLECLFAGIREACDALGVSLVGGHTEVTPSVTQPVAVGTMLGEVDRDRLVTTGGACVGDVVLVTKGVPLEGAAILARERGDEAVRRGVPPGEVERAREFLRRPGIGVTPEARAACGAARVHAMHDPTEGGIATACWELAMASERGLRIERERIPVLPEGRRLCEAFGLDPLGMIASGALLITVAPEDAATVSHACEERGIPCSAIGEVVPRAEGVSLVDNGRVQPMPSFPQDEIARVLVES